MTQTIKITELTLDRSLQIRNGLKKAAVQRYMDSDGLLPPIDVFKLPDGIIVVADGWHRIAAAEGRGENDISCTVHKGTLKDAEAFAIVANCKHGLPLTITERNHGILRLAKLGWKQPVISDEMSVDQATVSRVLAADKVARVVEDMHLHIPKSNKKQVLTQQDCLAIAAAPQEQWKPLAKASIIGNWSAGETAQAVANMKDERVTDAERKKMLQGAVPIAFAPDGERAITGATVRRVMGEPSPHDANIAFGKIETAILTVKDNWTVEQTVDSIALEKRDFENLLKDLPAYIAYLQAILDEAKKRQSKLRLVK